MRGLFTEKKSQACVRVYTHCEIQPQKLYPHNLLKLAYLPHHENFIMKFNMRMVTFILDIGIQLKTHISTPLR